MFKMGEFYLTTKGQLVKVFNTFKFADGYTINAAIHVTGHGWTSVRYAPDGRCNTDNDNYKIVGFESASQYPNYMQYVVWFDRASGKWCGRASDPRNQVVVSLNNIEHRERAMGLIQLGAELKVLEWMREAGYDEESKEFVNA